MHFLSSRLEDSKQQFLEKHAQVFTGTGKFPGLHKIVLKENSIVQQSVPHRLIPHTIAKKMPQKLRAMQKGNIIEKVLEIKPKMVINNLVVREKSDETIRVCN